MALQADGQPWDADEAAPFGPPDRARQPFYPDASRVFEEIDRLTPGDDGLGGHLARLADFDFYRPAPPAGYTRGQAEADRTDVGRGDIEPEERGRDYFPYRPVHRWCPKWKRRGWKNWNPISTGACKPRSPKPSPKANRPSQGRFHRPPVVPSKSDQSLCPG